MGKLNRSVRNETQETETKTVLTSESPVDISFATMGDIFINCRKCNSQLHIGRNLLVKVCCMECGSYDFISQSNFNMESPEEYKYIKAGEYLTGERKGTGIWKVW